MTSPKFLADEKYINLETYKRDETPVKTPVWFVVDGEKLYVITRESTGKVKRLANNPKVKLAACSFSGNVHGDWFSGTASRIEGKESDDAVKLRKKKYGFKALLAGFMTKAKGELVVYSIELE